jgi:hypothetical protein
VKKEIQPACCWRWKGYTLQTYTAGGAKTNIMHIHTAGGLQRNTVCMSTLLVVGNRHILHVHTACGAKRHICMSILLEMQRDTPCMPILLEQRDTPRMAILLAVQKHTYIRHVHIADAAKISILHVTLFVVKRDTPDIHTTYSAKRYILHVHTAVGWKGNTLHIRIHNHIHPAFPGVTVLVP